jgi:hypothetical protein
MTLEDLPELRKLQKEWFPVNYDDNYYIRIIENRAHCIIAETTLEFYIK